MRRLFTEDYSLICDDYKPGDFGRHIEILGASGSTVEIGENGLLDALPNFMPFLSIK